uniref:Uncharacterized protein n=1 Tax=Parascaris univalens TaxID=6257 RepID=A0A915CGM8_PARUN
MSGSIAKDRNRLCGEQNVLLWCNNDDQYIQCADQCSVTVQAAVAVLVHWCQSCSVLSIDTFECHTMPSNSSPS